jgi:hypothetical protein
MLTPLRKLTRVLSLWLMMQIDQVTAMSMLLAQGIKSLIHCS